MRHYLILACCLLLFLLNSDVFAQNQTNVWYFGGKGLDFNFTPPRVLTDNAMKSSEGVASIADEDGKLLFYTNGDTIWNKNHAVMANGLDLPGHISSRQGALIIPKPGSKSLYYLFTTDAFENNLVNGLRYSELDMTRQGGLGEVIRKNVFLQALAEENLTATGSCSCLGTSKQYWLAADRADEPGYLYVYRIDDKGIMPQPEISFLPGVANITYLKFSPVGDKIAFTGLNTAQEPIIGLADFNQVTGQFSNPVLFQAGHKDDYHRALEFSSNGKVLYYTGWEPASIVQYDLTQPNASKILTSAFVLTDFKYRFIKGPQLASDGKIYFTNSVNNSTSKSYLSVIDYPNLLGVASSFRPNAISDFDAFMLPNFVTSYLYTNDSLRLNLNAGPDQQVCKDSSVQLGGRASKSLTYRWSPGTFLSDSTTPNPIFTYTGPLEKEITLQYVLSAADGPCVRRDTVQITVYPLPQLTLSGSLSVCPQVEGVSYQVNFATEGQTYHWRVNGGTIKNGQGTAAITVNWGPSNAAALVEVIPINPQGCEGLPVVLPVRINVILDTETPQGPTQVCANQLADNVYQVTNTSGSVYTWGVMGGIITGGQGTAQVTVSWRGLGDHRIWLQEQSTTRDTVCFGASDTLRVNVYQDRTILTLGNVSVDSTDERRVILNWFASDPARLSAPVNILRREQGATNWQPAGRVTSTEPIFTDQNLETDNQVYEYQVEGQNGCGETIASNRHHTILLVGETAANGKITLKWNAYISWPAGVERYEVWRQLDNDPTFKLVGEVIGSELTFTGTSSLAGFAHHYRIKAIANQATYVSWSNDLALNFTHELLAPNIFTPNKDGTNDTFAVPLLELYPDNQFTVYNRWGQPVFSEVNYNNNWSAEGLTAGTYYYSLLLRQTGKLLKGWVEVVK